MYQDFVRKGRHKWLQKKVWALEEGRSHFTVEWVHLRQALNTWLNFWKVFSYSKESKNKTTGIDMYSWLIKIEKGSFKMKLCALVF